jgi:hypothetical protein
LSQNLFMQSFDKGCILEIFLGMEVKQDDESIMLHLDHYTQETLASYIHPCQLYPYPYLLPSMTVHRDGSYSCHVSSCSFQDSSRTGAVRA